MWHIFNYSINASMEQTHSISLFSANSTTDRKTCTFIDRNASCPHSIATASVNSGSLFRWKCANVTKTSHKTLWACNVAGTGYDRKCCRKVVLASNFMAMYATTLHREMQMSTVSSKSSAVADIRKNWLKCSNQTFHKSHGLQKSDDWTSLVQQTCSCCSCRQRARMGDSFS